MSWATEDFPAPTWVVILVGSLLLASFLIWYKVRPFWGEHRASRIVQALGAPRREPDGGFGQPPGKRWEETWTDVREDEELGITRAMVQAWRPKRDRKFWMEEKPKWVEVAILATYEQVMEPGKGYLTAKKTYPWAETPFQGWYAHGTLECVAIDAPYKRLTNVQVRPQLTPAGRLKRKIARFCVFVGAWWAGLGTGALFLWLLYSAWAVWLVAGWQAFFAALFSFACSVGLGKVWVPVHYRHYERDHPFFAKEKGYIQHMRIPTVPAEEDNMVWAIKVEPYLLDDPKAPETEDSVVRRSELAEVLERTEELKAELGAAENEAEPIRRKGNRRNAEERARLAELEERIPQLRAELERQEQKARELRGELLDLPGEECGEEEEKGYGIPEGYRFVNLREIKYYARLSKEGRVKIAPRVYRHDGQGMPLERHQSVHDVLRSYYHPSSVEQFFVEYADAKAERARLAQRVESLHKTTLDLGSHYMQALADLAEMSEHKFVEALPKVVDHWGGEVDVPSITLTRTGKAAQERQEQKGGSE